MTNLAPIAVVGRRPQGLDGVHAAAVAGEADDGPVRVGELQRRSRPGMPTPSEPPRVWKNEPGRRGGRYRVSSGEKVSASSKMIASVGQPARQLLHELRRVERHRRRRASRSSSRGRGQLVLRAPARPAARDRAARGRRRSSGARGRRRAPRGSASGRRRGRGRPGSSWRSRRRRGRRGRSVASAAKTSVEQREDLREDVGPDDQDGVRRADDRPAVRRRTCGRGARWNSGWASSMLTSDEFAPQTSAPSSSATRVSSAWAPEIATPSPMMMIGRVAAASRPAASSTSARLRRRRACRAARSGRSASSLGASRTSIGSATKTGPDRRRRGDLDRPAQDAQRRRRVDDARRPLRHRPRDGDEVGGHLGVHRVVADARTRRR